MRSDRWVTCRLCQDYVPQDYTVRYGIRHWTHVACAVRRWGWRAFLAKLSINEAYHAGQIAFWVQNLIVKPEGR